MLKIYNTLPKKKEVFKPLNKKRVNLFVCGPTVYDYSHLGHARTYLVFDMIVNLLRKAGYDVFYLQNITDIDDKIIKRAKERGITPEKLAKQFEKEYLADMKKLKVDSVTEYAKATDYIPEIISQIKRLKEKGIAYQLEDGVYYNVKKFKDYGKLSERKAEKADDALSRIDESKNKKNKADFCLWKTSKTGEPKWKSPFGEGRPGWHIEDTAITEKHFGFQYDLHGGASDLIFPHHEAEISQMEALSGKKPMTKYWIHTGFLTVEGKKMSKSLGNFTTIKDFLKKYSPEVLRLFTFSSHYKSPMDYSERKIIQIKSNLNRLDEFLKKIEKKTEKPKEIKETSFLKEYSDVLEDDFNTPKFFSKIFELIRETNKNIDKISKKEAEEIYNLFLYVDKIFKLFPKDKAPEELIKKLKERNNYRKEKSWKKADQMRKEIEEAGYVIADNSTGSELKKKLK